jgi:hypothetical protein
MRTRLIPLVVGLLAAGSAHALTITVPGDFDTIQEAIAYAADGDGVVDGQELTQLLADWS